jgi:hypothetical protein
LSGVSLWLRANWDRLLGLVLIGAGGGLLVLTYHGVASSRFVADQVSYLASGGVGGLFLLGLGAMVRIQADLHDEWRKLDGIESALRPSDATNTPAVVDGSGQPPGRRHSGASPASPEAPRRPLATAAGLAASAALGAVGFQRCANAGTADGAIAGLAVVVFGLAVAMATVTGSTLVLRRRVIGRARRLGAPFLRAASRGDDGDDVVFAGPGLARFHRAGCAMLARAGAQPVPRGDLDGRSPCGLCGAQ